MKIVRSYFGQASEIGDSLGEGADNERNESENGNSLVSKLVFAGIVLGTAAAGYYLFHDMLYHVIQPQP